MLKSGSKRKEKYSFPLNVFFAHTTGTCDDNSKLVKESGVTPVHCLHSFRQRRTQELAEVCIKKKMRSEKGTTKKRQMAKYLWGCFVDKLLRWK